MLFSSITFLYYFLPILLIIYFLVPSKYKNIVLLLFSLLFYFYGEPKYVIILLLSCIINYIIGNLIYKYNKKAKLFLIILLIYNIGQLFYFKYTNFFISNINNIFNSNIPFLNIIMPLGISFFTFQNLSYVIDIYNKKVVPSKNLLNYATYICLFPQLIAGPIVRYSTINKELVERNHSFNMFSTGVKRFTIGLAKKVLIANSIGEFNSIIKALPSQSILSYWLLAIGYTFQIYFDFSGYSDMAIGLGKMFGFNFLENFNYPLISKSITDFWRRWHISLSSWLRDYVYIPLGGNRVSKLKWIRNIFIVWFLTGFWHGASWNFIIWGLYFAIILLIEKLFLSKFLEKHKVFSYIYTILLVIISFVIFNVDGVGDIFIYLKNMFGITGLPLYNKEILYYFKSYFILFIITSFAATPIFNKILNSKNKIISVLEPIYYILILILSTAYLIDSSFNPFLYFRF